MRSLRALVALALLGGLASCVHNRPVDPPPTYYEPPARRIPTPGYAAPQAPPNGNVYPPWQVGYATWYGAALAGHKTASGERFDPEAMTAAHRTLPLGTWVDVTRPDNGLSVRVRINDRGPYGPGDRVIDLSRGAADRLRMRRAGVVRVEIRVVPP